MQEKQKNYATTIAISLSRFSATEIARSTSGSPHFFRRFISGGRTLTKKFSRNTRAARNKMKKERNSFRHAFHPPILIQVYIIYVVSSNLFEIYIVQIR